MHANVSWTSRDAYLSRNSLREYAGINSDAMLVGMGSRIEIWGAEKWEEQLERMDNAGEESMAESLSYLAGLGI